ncbi:hypothetical protein CANMA_000629 [Candida margitis]|uniref:uncharacterized protein n=1 Tax=Candida margitis TaxID=1775924 RepID=UPI002226DA9E|nr:uncharacterized protein CANMA_000629 [Candida margitis]KAI5970277.1 hypothetical protein CANMA_000629 [Candida margitis]
MTSEDDHKQMQIKILYSFDDNPTTFLSRSSQQYSVQTAEVPIQSTMSDEPELITLGGVELRSCIKQLLSSNPENFKLHSQDYAVYYKDITEQPDEPFVSNGVLSSLVSSKESCLIPGRVCQNMSASFLFGNKTKASSLTLEIRLKLHTIEGTPALPPSANSTQSSHSQRHQQQTRQPLSTINSSHVDRKRPYESLHKPSHNPAKATRTLSLPSYSNIQNIQQADRSNTTTRYNRESVENRFKSAPFFQEKAVYDNGKKRPKYTPGTTPSQQSKPSPTPSQLIPQRAVRTRSMFTNTPIMVSSPINEEVYSSDDPEYKANEDHDENIEEEEEEEDDDEDYGATSPYTPQQPPYVNKETPPALPEDLDSKRTHTITSAKLPENHGLVCINSCCRTQSSIAWKYFETEYKPHFSALIRATEFDKKHYEGMLGPLCNACFLFYKNKGFMRPEHVVRKYNQQQRYTQKLKMKNSKEEESEHSKASLSAVASKKSFHSSPKTFPTPSHTPSAINQVIQNKYHGGQNHLNPLHSGQTPDYHDLLNQLNVYGGPSTDIDPLPGATPPMLATKSNTRIINVPDNDAKRATKQNTTVIDFDEGEDKENCPPQEVTNKEIAELDAMLQSIHDDSNSNWMNFFTDSARKDENSPNSKTPVDQNPIALLKKPSINSPSHSSNKSSMANMPSSPYLSAQSQTENNHSELDDVLGSIAFKHGAADSSPQHASRTDTATSLMNWQHNTSNSGMKDLGSTPNTDFFSNADQEGDKYDGGRSVDLSAENVHTS